MSQSCESCHHPSTTCLTGGMKCLVAAHYGQTSFVVFFKNRFTKLSHAVLQEDVFNFLSLFLIVLSWILTFIMFIEGWVWHGALFLFLWVLNSLTLDRDAGTSCEDCINIHLNAPDQQTAKSSAFIEVLTPAGTPTYFNSWVHRTWRRSCAKKKATICRCLIKQRSFSALWSQNNGLDL